MGSFCRSCGAEVRAESRFCPKCGKPVTSAVPEESVHAEDRPTEVLPSQRADTPTAVQPPVHTPSPTAVQPPVYSAAAPTATQPLQSASVASPRRSKTPMIVAGALVLLVLVAGGGVAYSKGLIGGDDEAPAVAVETPKAGDTIEGENGRAVVKIRVRVKDDTEVGKLQLTLDDEKQTLAPEGTSEEYVFEYSWAIESDGAHKIVAKAEDGAGNVKVAEPVEFTVESPAPEPVYEEPSEDEEPTAETGEGETDESDWQRYTSDEWGYSIEYPSDWRIESENPTERIERVRFLSPDGDKQFFIDAFTMNSKERATTPMDNFRTLDKAFSKKTGYELISLDSAELASSPAAEWIFMREVDELGLQKRRNLCVDAGNVRLAVLYSADPSAYDDGMPIFDRVLESLELSR